MIPSPIRMAAAAQARVPLIKFLGPRRLLPKGEIDGVFLANFCEWRPPSEIFYTKVTRVNAGQYHASLGERHAPLRISRSVRICDF